MKHEYTITDIQFNSLWKLFSTNYFLGEIIQKIIMKVTKDKNNAFGYFVEKLIH